MKNPLLSPRLESSDGTITPLKKPKFLVGRFPENDLVLKQADVSGSHAMITRSGNGYELSDLNSRNGTSVNGARLRSSIILSEGDEIRFASSRFRFCLGAHQRGLRTDINPHAIDRACRVYVAGAPSVFMDGIIKGIEQVGSLMLVGSGSDDRQLGSLVSTSKAELLVCVGSGRRIANTIKSLLGAPANLRIVAVVQDCSPEIVSGLLELGVHGCGLTTDPTPQLIQVLLSAARGTDACTQSTKAAGARLDSLGKGYWTLTAKEKEVFWRIAEGCQTAAIAEKLGITVKTVGTHKENLKNKLGFENTAALEAAASVALNGR